MIRVPAALALSFCMILAACESPEAPETPETTQTPAATAPVAAEPTPVMPDDAPPQEETGNTPGATAAACSDTLGEAAAIRLAERCTLVSPASHPPCNPANPCTLIQGEIDRACGQYGPGETKPAECAA